MRQRRRTRRPHYRCSHSNSPNLRSRQNDQCRRAENGNDHDSDPAQVEGAELKSCVNELAAAKLLLRHYPTVGKRHEAFRTLGGFRARAGWGVDKSLSQGELARMLAPFEIRPKTTWPLQRTPTSRSAKGYLRSRFEQAWASYCDASDDDGPGGTSSQSSTVRHLRGV
jgi:hypothetical protein